MELGIFNTLKRYFQAGGAPEQVIDLLSSNYHAYAQMANLMAEWIISAGTCNAQNNNVISAEKFNL